MNQAPSHSRHPVHTPGHTALPPALTGERISFGGISGYVAGSGPPLVLVHSVNAAPSAAEMRPLLEHYRATRTVFALDLPGFGLSDRSDRRYDPRLMTDALHALADQVNSRCGEAPIDALAASLGCEFLARAAAEQPARWGRLAFVSPTGLSGTTARRGAPGSTRALPWLHRLLSAGPWADPLYRALTQPVWMSHGVRGALPYVERPSAFFQAFDAFLGGATANAAPTGPARVPREAVPV